MSSGLGSWCWMSMIVYSSLLWKNPMIMILKSRFGAETAFPSKMFLSPPQREMIGECESSRLPWLSKSNAVSGSTRVLTHIHEPLYAHSPFSHLRSQKPQDRVVNGFMTPAVHHLKQNKLVLSRAHCSSVYSLPPEEPRAIAQAHPFHIVFPFIMTVKHVLPILPFAFKDLLCKRGKCKQTPKQWEKS